MNWCELNYLQYSAPTSKERVEARKLLDAERVRLYNLDRETGSRLLLKWTQEIMEGFTMPEVEIDDSVEIPSEAPKSDKPKGRRGRPKGSGSKPAENAHLLAAVDFIAVVQNETFENSQYAKFVSTVDGNHICAHSNIISASHPVAESLSVCPQIDKLKAALNRCGKTLAITQTEGGQISIKGDKLRAVVPCLAEPLPDIAPDMPVVIGDFDILKEAFKAACTVADEKAERPMFASVLLDPNTVTATNGKVMLQYWHGIASLPPGTVLPKIFAQDIAKQKYKITGIGGNFDAQAGFMRSLTIWFENGSWIKTQCYEDRWQQFDHILNVATNPVEVYPGLFDAVAAIEPFCEEHGAVHFVTGAVQSHHEADTGAVYQVKDLPAGKVFNAKLIRQVEPYVKTIDLFAATDRGFFFGGTEANPVRGVFMGMAGSQ